jgi:hypothetical protein
MMLWKCRVLAVPTKKKMFFLDDMHLTLSVLTTLLPIFVHSALISGPIDPIDSKPNERELNLR